jgi:hypothetical protein
VWGVVDAFFLSTHTVVGGFGSGIVLVGEEGGDDNG